MLDTKHYRVWRRNGRGVEDHLPVGDGGGTGAAPLDCSTPEAQALMTRARREGKYVLAAPPRADAVVVQAYRRERIGATTAGPVEGFLVQQGGFSIATPAARPGRYEAYLQGSVGSGQRLYIGTRVVGEAFGDLGLIDAWQPLGPVLVQRPRPRLFLTGLEKPWWQSGSTRPNVVGPLALVRERREPAIERVPAAASRKLCGRRVDWLALAAKAGG